MSQMEIDRVVSQMRVLRAQVNGPSAQSIRPGELGALLPGPAGVGGASATGATNAMSFASVLRNGLERINEAQAQSSASQRAFERGDPGLDLPQVMIDMQKASIAFRGAVEVRNRMISAYQEIMNMPV
jgi:flagellar hook-basal body complex protein FliE